MKNAKRVYNALLKLYPSDYRKEFGAEMTQTFVDSYRDIKEAEGHVRMTFWASAITDEIKNIMEQQRTSLMEKTTSLNVTVSRVAVAAALVFPLYAVFYAALIRVSLALPHPPVSGIGFLIALIALLFLSGVLSGAASYALVSVFPKREAGIA